MRIALYIEHGREQIVLTPQSETEASILEKIHDGSRSISLKRGAFYACQGGWTRHRAESGYGLTSMRPQSDDESTMIVLDPKPEPVKPVEEPDENDARYNAFAAGYVAALGMDSESNLSENRASNLSVAWANWRAR